MARVGAACGRRGALPHSIAPALQMQSLVPRGELENGPQDPELKSLLEKYQTLQTGASRRSPIPPCAVPNPCTAPPAQYLPHTLHKRTTDYRQLSTDRSGLSAKVNENVLVKEVGDQPRGRGAGRLGAARARFDAIHQS